MKKIINGKKYDTETAERLGNYCHGFSNDFAFCTETLYRKKTGEFFVFGDGGPMSKYEGYEKIIPMTEKQARVWAEEHLECEECESIFGEYEE